MRAILIAAILLAAGPVHADAIARQGSDWIRLSISMCTNPLVLAVIERVGQQADLFRVATGHVAGKDYAACWTPAAGGALLFYEDGDYGLIPAGNLTAVPEA